jgi:DNA-binding NtrC family response regulator
MPTAEPVIAVLDDEPEMRKALHRLLTGRDFVSRSTSAGSSLPPWVHHWIYCCGPADAGSQQFDVLEAFNSRHIHVPAIVITAHDEPGAAERARVLGASAYMKKPVDRDALLLAIAAATSHDRSK